MLVLLAGACRAAPSSDPPEPSASPQAKAEPAPIASPPTASPAVTPTGSASAGSPLAPRPQPMRPDEPVPVEAIARDAGHEPTAKDTPRDVPAVYTLSVALRSTDIAPPPKGLELSPSGLDAARRKSEPSLSVDLTPGHARAVLHEGFVLPEGTELRERSDRFGYVVLSPGGDSYRVGATGSLRAILGEGLFEVAPASQAAVVFRGEGVRRLGRATRHVEVTTRAAKGSFELGRVPELGDAGALLCRLLLDLMSTQPATPVCADGDVPLHVELKWSAPPPRGAGGRERISGTSVFDVVSLVRRSDVPVAGFLTPPPNATFLATGEPARGAHLFLARADLAALHIGSEPAPPHPGEGAAAVLSLHNSTDELRYVWLDGIPLAWLAPGGRLDVSGVPHARATLQWRTFLGDAIDPAETVTLPATVDALPATGAPGAPVTSSDSPPP